MNPQRLHTHRFRQRQQALVASLVCAADGEKFAEVMPECDAENALCLAKRNGRNQADARCRPMRWLP